MSVGFWFCLAWSIFWLGVGAGQAGGAERCVACDRILTDELTGDDAFVVAGEILTALADPETTP